jgi:hypothetical protein
VVKVILTDTTTIAFNATSWRYTDAARSNVVDLLDEDGNVIASFNTGSVVGLFKESAVAVLANA